MFGDKFSTAPESQAGVGFVDGKENHWHRCIRFSFMTDYVEYLETQLGFSAIDVKPAAKR